MVAKAACGVALIDVGGTPTGSDRLAEELGVDIFK